MTLWSVWACKETAYKVIKKTFPDTAFIPRLWQTVFAKTHSECSEGEVIISDAGSVFIRLFSNVQYLHCVGADHPAALDKLIWSVEALPEEKAINPSLFLRECLGEKVADNFSLNFHDIKIKRTRANGELQPPCIYTGGRKTNIDISLSHDGRFVAYAFWASDGRNIYPGRE